MKIIVFDQESCILHVMIEVFKGNELSWFFLFLFIAFLVYGAFKIKDEFKEFEEEGYLKKLGAFEFMFPSWWSLTDLGPLEIELVRADTRYDWFARFKVLQPADDDFKENGQDFSFEDYFFKWCLDNEVEVDVESYGAYEKIVRPQYLIKSSELLDQVQSFYWIECAFTHQQNDRGHLLWLGLQMKGKEEVLTAYSWSSILNGPIEGPFFEEVIKGMKVSS